MEGAAVLLVLAFLALPILAIAAFIRAGKANELAQNLAGRITVLEREIRQLRERPRETLVIRETAEANAPESKKTAPAIVAPPVAKETPLPQKPKSWLDEELAPKPAPQTKQEAPPPPPTPSPAPKPETPAPVRKPAPAAVAPPPRPPRPTMPAINWEQFMGAKLFAWIGGLALFLGVAFFVKYSFEHNLIPPEIRVAIGFALGIGLLGGGVAMKKKAYAVTSQTLCSTGVLILYASTFACRGFYHFAFFGVIPTFLLMTLITTVAFLLAVRLDAPVVAILGMLGGFITPVLLSTGEDRPLALFGYIALLDAGLLAVALNRRWNYLAPLGALGTAIMEIGWASRFFEQGAYFENNRVFVPMSVTLGFVALFLAATALAKRRGWTDRILAVTTLGLVMAALGFGVYFLGFDQLGARPILIFGYVVLVAIAALVLAVLDGKKEQQWNGFTLFGGIAAALMQFAWAVRCFGKSGFSEGNKVFVPMGITVGFIAMFLGVTALARRRGWVDRAAATSTFLLVAVAFAFGLFFLGFDPLGARPGLIFGFIFIVTVAALALGLLDGKRARQFNAPALFAAVGAAVIQLAWTKLFFVQGLFFEQNKVLIPMAIEVVFVALFLGVAAFAKRHGSTDRTFGFCALLLVLVAFGFGFFQLDFPLLAARPALVFSFFFIVDLAVLALVLLDGKLAVVQPIVGLIVFAALGIWTGNSMTDALLNTGLALYLVFAVFHAVMPLVLRCIRPAAPPPAWSQCFPALALLLAIFPMLQSSALSFLVWPFVLLVDILAVLVAALTTALLPIALVLILTLVLVGAWLLHIPATLTGLPTSLWMLGGFAVFFVLASMWASQRIVKRGPGIAARGPIPPEQFAKLLPACSAVLPFLLLLMVVARLPLANPSPVFGLALLLVVLLLGVSRLLAVDELPLIGLLSTLALEHGWHYRDFDPTHAALPLAWNVGFYAIFTIFPFLFRKDFSGKIMPWIAAALSGLLHFKLVHTLIQTAWPNHAMGLLPAAFAIPTLLAVVTLVKTTPATSPARNSQLALFGGVALFFITLIFPIQFDRQWITIGWALEGAALCWLYHRIVHPGLRIVGVALLSIAFARLALNPAVLDYHPRGDTAIFNWFLYAYSVVIACLFAAARLLAPPRNRVLGLPVPPLLNGLGTVLAFLLVNIEIADYFTEPGAAVVTLSFSGNLARDMSYSIAWALFALLLVIVGIRQKNGPIRWAGLGLLGLTLAKLFLHDLSQLSQLYRIAALIIVAIIAMLASFLYQRFLSSVENADDPKTPPPVP